ncbi:MAG: hypothetical protein JXB88_24430 [Spirochaetales bacterium]|nr:hypothetical protein [Spirochaetales bacterium]
MMKISCKYYVFIFLLLFLTELLSGYEFKITKVGHDYAMTQLKVQEGKKPPDLKILQIYDVFEKMEIIDGKRIFINFIDSVYLKEVKKEELYFAFIWEGESRVLKANYILASTGRFYTFPGIPFEQITEEPRQGQEKKSKPLPGPPGFAYMILAGYTILHNIPYGESDDPPILPGFLTADFVVLFPFDLGLRFTAATRHTFDQLYVQASGINYKGIVNSFLKFYTELGVGYPFALSEDSQIESSVILVAQYGLLFDFRGLFKWGYFAVDLYVNGNFPVNTILQGMYLNYGLKIGVRL